MKLDELLKSLTGELKIPGTLEEAVDQINKDPVCQTTIEDLTFKQVVINILIASGIVTEDDFNQSVTHFKNLLTKQFAENLLERLKMLHQSDIELEEIDDPLEDNSDDWPDDKIGKA